MPQPLGSPLHLGYSRWSYHPSVFGRAGISTTRSRWYGTAGRWDAKYERKKKNKHGESTRLDSTRGRPKLDELLVLLLEEADTATPDRTSSTDHRLPSISTPIR